MLTTDARTRMKALIDWLRAYSTTRGTQVLDGAGAAPVDWSAADGWAAGAESVDAPWQAAGHWEEA
jgi:hypothetical protein